MGQGDELVEGRVVHAGDRPGVEVVAEDAGLVVEHRPVDRRLRGAAGAAGEAVEEHHADEEDKGADGEDIRVVGGVGLQHGEDHDHLGQGEAERAPEHPNEGAGARAADHDHRHFRERDEEHVRGGETVGHAEHGDRVEVDAAGAEDQEGDRERDRAVAGEQNEHRAHGDNGEHGDPQLGGDLLHAEHGDGHEGACETDDAEPVGCPREGTAERRLDQMAG